MTWLIPSDSPDAINDLAAGGKGASLGRLRQMGANVPDFFIVSADAFRNFQSGAISEEFGSEMKRALAMLNVSRGLAVRSSAIGEDSPENSFAGLYQTILNVHGLDSVISAIQDCWASYQNAAAQCYRDGRLPGSHDGAMAVVVQEMLIGDWAGVCFTANPVNLSLSEVVINAIPGLGEDLVSGNVNPDEITLSAADGEIKSRVEGAQAHTLPSHIALEIWRECRRIAELFRFPQDIEWSCRNGQIFILQSRPITTIADVFYSREIEPWKDAHDATPDDPDRIWSRMLADETWVSPISPLFYNIHNSTPGRVNFIRSHGDNSYLPPDLFKYHLATAYCDTRLITRMYEYQPKLARIRGILNFLPEEMQAEFKLNRFRWYGRLTRQLSYELSNRKIRSFFKNYAYVNKQWSDYVSESNKWFDCDLDALSLDELRHHQADVRQTMIKVGGPCAIAVLSHAQDLHLFLTGLLERWFHDRGSDGEALYARVSAGLDNSETVKVADAIWILADDIKKLGDVAVIAAREGSWHSFKERIEVLRGGTQFIYKFEEFWRAHRHLGSTYKDVIWPRWGDDIDLCFTVAATSNSL